MSRRQLVNEGMRFLAVGGVGYVVDLAVFNALLYAGDGMLHHKPVTAKVIATVVATLVAYAGNRWWTFRHRAYSGVAREYALFFALNGVGLVISAGCLAVSRYVLDLSGPLADNVSANVVGVGLASAFRFWSYRTWVFKAAAPVEVEAPAAPADGGSGGDPGGSSGGGPGVSGPGVSGPRGE